MVTVHCCHLLIVLWRAPHGARDSNPDHGEGTGGARFGPLRHRSSSACTVAPLNRLSCVQRIRGPIACDGVLVRRLRVTDATRAPRPAVSSFLSAGSSACSKLAEDSCPTPPATLVHASNGCAGSTTANPTQIVSSTRRGAAHARLGRSMDRSARMPTDMPCEVERR